MSRTLCGVLTLAILATGGEEGLSQTWTYLPGRLRERQAHAMAYDHHRNVVVMFGGGLLSESRDSWEYDGTAWRPGVPAPESLPGRSQTAMVYDGTRRLLVLFGGYSASHFLGDTWECDGTAWRPGGQAPPDLGTRMAHAMAFDAGRGRTVLYGGFSGAYEKDTWEYDGAAWLPAAASPVEMGSRIEHAMAFDEGRGVVVLTGGFGGTSRNDAWEYDGTSWTPGAPPPSGAPGRESHAMVYDRARGRMVIFGGCDVQGSPYGDTWTYDGATWSELVIGGPSPRSELAMAYDAARDRVVLFGGNPRAAYGDDTWEFDGAAWIERVEPPTPRRRSSHAMAYDAARRRVILYGGHDGDTREDTWELDGISWSEISPTSPPGPRFGHRMVFDVARGRIVLFGGQRTGSWFLNDTWELDASGWRPGASPPPELWPRSSHGMSYDSVRGRILLFGGWSDTETFGDTWIHAGTGWFPAPPSPDTPSPRAGHGMAFDSRRDRTVVAGGKVSGQPCLDDVWEHDGSVWKTADALPQSLGGLWGLTLTFHAARGRTVLFGGFGVGEPLPDIGTWEYDGASWVKTAEGYPARRASCAMAYRDLDRSIVLNGGRDIDDLGETWSYGSERSDVAVAKGAGPPNSSRVRAYDEHGIAAVTDFLAYGAAGWGANLGVADLDGALPAEILTGPGPGSVLGPHVRPFDALGVPVPGRSFYAYATLRSGVEVHGGDVDGTGEELALTGPGPGSVFGPHVRGWDLTTRVTPVGRINFHAYGTLRYGVNSASADVDGDDAGEIVTAPGPGPAFVSHVRGWTVAGGMARPLRGLDFRAFPSAGHGARVGVGQALRGGANEIVATLGPGPASAARFVGFSFSGGTISALPGLDATPFATSFGGRVAIDDPGPDEMAQLFTAPGPDPAAPATIESFSYDGAALIRGVALDPFPGARYGASPASGNLGL